MMVTQTQSYLCGSAPVQKPLSKLLEVQEERSQCGPAMGRSEEAGQRHFEGLHLGLNDVRAPALTAKHASLVPTEIPGEVHAVTLSGYSGATCDHLEKTAIHLHRRSLTASPPSWRGKNRPIRLCRKGWLTRWRGEGLPNSLHLRDGSRSVVALPSGGGVKRETTEKVL